MEKIVVYGIANCDIIKKSLGWFKKNNITVELHDYKTSGITKEKLEEWISKVGIEMILNKRSTTWRELPAAEQEKVNNIYAAIKIMMNNNSIIKRPVVESGNTILVGYDESAFKKLLINK